MMVRAQPPCSYNGGYREGRLGRRPPPNETNARTLVVAGAEDASMAEEIIIVQGNNTLAGDVAVSGAKNSALKLIAAALLGQGETTIHNVPLISDISIMSDVLRCLAMGYNSSTTASKLSISWNTVRTHTRNVYGKLGVHSQQELIDCVERGE